MTTAESIAGPSRTKAVESYVIVPSMPGMVDIYQYGQSPMPMSAEAAIEYLADAPDEELSVCWNLDQTIAPLLKALGKQNCETLYKTGRCFHRPYSIFYIEKKVFGVHRVGAKRKLSLYGIDQFYPENDEPSTVEELQVLAQDVVTALGKMGLEATRLSSAIALYDEQQMRHFSLPTGQDMPREAAFLAWQCGGKLWIENFVMGYWEKAYDYDIVSAFPSVARELVDIRYLDWVHTEMYQSDAVYGYAKCEVQIHEWVKVHPIIHRHANGELSCPWGWFEEYLTKGEIDFIRKEKLGDVEILDAWWGKPKEDKRLPRPLAMPLDRMFAHKESNDPLGKRIAKSILVGNYYGRFGEERKKAFGPHWNPCYFAEISTQTRLRVADFLYAHFIGPGDGDGYRHLLHVSVDGVLLDTPVIPADMRGIRVGLGSWKLDSVSPALVISSGLLYLGGKHPKGLWLEDVLTMINLNPGHPYYERGTPRMVTLGEALTNKKFEELGMVKDFYSTIDLLSLEQERVFDKVPRTGGELLKNTYRSQPDKVWEV